MSNIKVLESSVANIIAAGEVVEDPSSLVKELVENSVDADAKKISIEVGNGGRNITVKDNGCGMDKEDLFLCIKRHATSKISNKNDLFNLSTYGFRGEALASISHVSRMAISSKQVSEPMGNRILIEAGKVEKVEEVAKEMGTEMILEDLFFNVPARLKFLRRPEREYAKIKSIILKEALVNSNISFNLRIDGKEVLRTSGGGMENTILELFNKNVLESLTKFELGYLGGINLVKGTREYIFTYFNKRYAKSVMVEKAIIDAYYTKLPKGKYPFVILMIDVDPKIIDVNVHPSKKIVKFSNESDMYKMVRKKVEDGIFMNDREIISASVELKRDSTKNWNTNKPSSLNNLSSISSFNGGVEPKIEEKKESLNVFVDGSKQSSVNIQMPNEKPQNSEVIPKGHMENKTLVETSANKTSDIVAPNIPFPHIENDLKDNLKIDNEIANKSKDYFIENKFVGQVANTFSIVECSDRIEIYDQHIVQERVLYEELKKNFYDKKLQSQALLVPVKVDLEIMEKDAVTDNIDLLHDFGFEIEEFGERSILVRSVPAFDLRVSVKETLESLIQELMVKSRDEIKDIRERIIITMSCKQSIKAGDDVAVERIKKLINRLHEIGKYTCPHGRRIVVEIPMLYIEKQFNRK